MGLYSPPPLHSAPSIYSLISLPFFSEEKAVLRRVVFLFFWEVAVGSTKKDRKTKEFPRIDWTVFENGIGGLHEWLGSVEARDTGC